MTIHTFKAAQAIRAADPEVGALVRRWQRKRRLRLWWRANWEPLLGMALMLGSCCLTLWLAWRMLRGW